MTTIYNKKDIYYYVNNGLALLPSLFKYNPTDINQEPIELQEEDILIFFSPNNSKVKRYIKLCNDIDNSGKRNVFITTLSRKGFEKFKEEFWNIFDSYQKNNAPRYYDTISHLKKFLTKEEFMQSYEKQYSRLEIATLEEMYVTELRYEKIKYAIDLYNLDYEGFKKNKLQKKAQYQDSTGVVGGGQKSKEDV